MKVGCLGDITFEVSEKTIRTITNASWSGEATFQTHQRHLKTELTEFVGVRAEEFKFDVVLSSYLGIDVMSEIQKIRKYRNAGTTLPLVIGNQRIGTYRWTITSVSVAMQTFGRNGILTAATVTIGLKEYVKR